MKPSRELMKLRIRCEELEKQNEKLMDIYRDQLHENVTLQIALKTVHVLCADAVAEAEVVLLNH